MPAATVAVVIILVLWAVIAGYSVVSSGSPLPAPWLKEWSDLIAKVVAAAIGVRALWVAPKLLADFLKVPASRRNEPPA